MLFWSQMQWIHHQPTTQNLLSSRSDLMTITIDSCSILFFFFLIWHTDIISYGELLNSVLSNKYKTDLWIEAGKHQLLVYYVSLWHPAGLPTMTIKRCYNLQYYCIYSLHLLQACCWVHFLLYITVFPIWSSMFETYFRI